MEHSCKRCERVQSSPCEASHNAHYIIVGGCCHCLDKRTGSKVFSRYIDGVGDIDTRMYGIPFPKDIGYCPACRVTKVNTAELDIDLAKAYLRKHPELCQFEWAQKLMEDDPYLFTRKPIADK